MRRRIGQIFNYLAVSEVARGSPMPRVVSQKIADVGVSGKS